VSRLSRPPRTLPIESPFGRVALLWSESDAGPRVDRVVLPNEVLDLPPFPAPREVALLAEQVRRFLRGEAVSLPLNLVSFSGCSPFQRRVLLAEYEVPRGHVTTYGRLARRLGVPGGARAVGRALATNPLPILIPCHRAVREGGELGGFRGGLPMKESLLHLEGVRFVAPGRVAMDQVHG
jgi:methylated-DNA-[protein]-cysteine S-methyltransferase